MRGENDQNLSLNLATPNSKRSPNRKNGALINSDVRDSEKNQNDQTRGGGRAADADQID